MPTDDREADLLGLLMVLTFTTGVIDAISFVGLGRVFTANMTGNVVFVAFALAGAEGFSIRRPLASLVVFFIGALIAGHWAHRRAMNAPRRLLMIGASAEAALLLLATGISVGHARPASAELQFSLIGITALAMGIRNAMVRELGVRDVTTTLLTVAISGLAGESLLAGGSRERAGRKALSIVMLFAGALVGTVLLLKWDFVAPLGLSAVLAALVAVIAGQRARATERF